MQILLAAVEALIREPIDAPVGTLARKTTDALNALEVVRRDVAAAQSAETATPATDTHPLAPKV